MITAANNIKPSVIPFPKVELRAPVSCSLEIDLDVVAYNYQFLKASAPTAVMSGVVKADGYGVGAVPVTKKLYKAGCRHFFTARLEEALEIKEAGLADDATIYVLNGLFTRTEHVFAHYGFVPVLTDAEKIQRWATYTQEIGKTLEAILHVDTGMNRTGITVTELEENPHLHAILRTLNISHVMTHLSRAGDMNEPFNEEQRTRLLNAVDLIQFPKRPKISLAASSGIFLGEDYHFDLIRPGLSLYTHPLFKDKTRRYGLKEAVRLWGLMYQVQKVKKGETIGYDRTYTLERDSVIATITVGYAAGFTWSINRHTPSKAYAVLGDYKLPIIGRISMDLITLDVTDVPEDLLFEGQRVELLNDTITVHTHAEWSDLRPYEILLKFGKHIKREYLNP